jgi:hypothetical protein
MPADGTVAARSNAKASARPASRAAPQSLQDLTRLEKWSHGPRGRPAHPGRLNKHATSQMGQTRKSALVTAMSAFPPIATKLRTSREVRFVPETDFASTKQCRTWDGLAAARLTPTRATDPHAGRTHLLRCLRRARCEPLLWRVSVARPRHFRGAQAMDQPA